MTTIKKFLNAGDAALAKSFVEAAGIDALLTDDGTGYSYANGGLRLQVADNDAARARHVIDDTEEPLPDDFVPPEEPPSVSNTRRAPGWILAFLTGGVSALVVFPLLSILFPALREQSFVDFGGWIGLFLFGGSIAVIIGAALSSKNP